MIVYFELHFDDAGDYWIDKIEPNVNPVLDINPQYGFSVNYVNGSKHDDYWIFLDLSVRNYGGDGQLRPILDKFKKDYLLELREKKIKKLIGNQK